MIINVINDCIYRFKLIVESAGLIWIEPDRLNYNISGKWKKQNKDFFYDRGWIFEIIWSLENGSTLIINRNGDNLNYKLNNIEYNQDGSCNIKKFLEIWTLFIKDYNG